MPQRIRRVRQFCFMASLVLFCFLLLGGSASSIYTGTPNGIPPLPGASRTVIPMTTPTPLDTAAEDQPIATTGCGHVAPIAPGTSMNQTIPSVPALSNGEQTRVYRVHVPASYQPDQPIPVVLFFHGYGGDAAGADASSGFSTLAEQKGFLAVYPQGVRLRETGSPFWASLGPIDDGVDDIRYVSDLLTALQRDFCVDARRIYATGFSNGGGMVAFLACRLAQRIAAFAPVSGNFYIIPGGCHPDRPVPLLDFHGTADGVLPYNGIPASVNPKFPLPAIPDWLQAWAARDGCTSGPVVFLQAPPVTGEQWAGCKGEATVVHYRIDGGGHAWPPMINGQSAQDVIWNFFQAHPLPSR